MSKYFILVGIFIFLQNSNLVAERIIDVGDLPDDLVNYSDYLVCVKNKVESIIDVGDLPDGIIDVGDLPDGIIDVGDLPDGIIDVGDLPDGIIDVGDLPDGIIDVGDLPDGFLPAKLLGHCIIDVGDLPGGIIDVGDLPDGVIDTQKFLVCVGNALQVSIDSAKVAKLQRAYPISEFVHCVP